MRDSFLPLSLAAILFLLLPLGLLPAGLALAGLGAAVLALRRRGEMLLLGLGALVAGASLAWGGIEVRSLGSERWVRAEENRLQALLERLERAAETAGERVTGLTEPSRRVEAFDRLSALAGGAGSEWSYLLYDRDGDAVAWSGEGLLHDVDAMLPRGRHTGYLAGFTAVTLYTAHLLEDGGGWIIAGRSYPRDRLPFAAGLLLDRSALHWWIENEGAGSAPEAAGRGVAGPVGAPGARTGWRLGSARGFDLLAAARPGMEPAPRARLWAELAIAVALVLGALHRGRAAVRAGAAAVSPGSVGPAALGIAAIARATGATTTALAVLIGAGVVALSWHRLAAATSSRWLGARALLGAALGLLAAHWIQGLGVAPDLGEQLGASGVALAYRTTMLVLALAVIAPASTGGHAATTAGQERGRALLGAALGLLLLAAAVADHTVSASVLAIGGGVAATVAIARRPGGSGRWLSVVTAAALLAAVSWEIPYRAALRGRWQAALDQVVEPALDARSIELAGEMESYLASEEAREIVATPTTPGARQDLAVALWRRSPLARRDVASALQIDAGEPERSLFSYGLTVREGEVDPESLPPAGVRANRWIDGGATLEQAQGPGAALFWIVPLAVPTGPASLEQLEIDLMRGRSMLEGGSLPGGAALAVHRGQHPLLLPWPRSTPPEPADHGVARTPQGPAWYWSRHHQDATYTVYLPRLGALAGLERVGIHATSSLLAAGALAALALLLALGDRSFRRRLDAQVRSYSRRLILILTVLIVVPLLLLDAVLVRSLDERLEKEHREAAEVALEVAQRVLSDYLLALEPGFGLRAVLEQEVLDWLAQVVDREVNVYWGPQSFASSRPELFTAGLLPRRIPGEVFSELALRQDALAARTRTAPGHSYLELYAPLELAQPEVPPDRRFYLSTPLLVQEEEVGLALARLGRRVAVVTVALLLLVLAVGSRLAAGFTRPVMAIVDGTGRIARGATSLELRPTEPELQSLVAAIDEMARRLAQGRAALLREKQVVEKMVESITAAVVSLDHEGRVLLHNRAAESLLGAEIGAPMAQAAASAPIAGLEAFLLDAASGGAPLSRRLRSGGSEEREWSVVWVPVPGGGDPAALLVVEDVTEILRAQRLEAWAEMARIIAHEVKNPLTPIRLSTEHMQQVFATDPDRFREVFERCTSNILKQVDELRVIASEFSTYSRVAHMDLRPGDAVGLARAATAAYQVAPPPGVEVRFEATVASAPTRFDERLLSRAVRNLIENAVRASRDHGEVVVGIGTEGETVVLEVSDRGPGVRADDLGRIFEPYFSTYDSGTGLGLPITRRIVEGHGGAVTAANREGGGLRVRITLPLADGGRPEPPRP